MATAVIGVAPTGRPTAQAAPDDIIAVVVEGTGLGHGRGMSQWGAYGWAVDQSKTWDWILDHYYGGTVAATVDAATTNIRVRLTDADDQLTVGVVSHGPGVQWNGLTRASMYATETAPGSWEVFGSAAVHCPSVGSITVPSGEPPIRFGSDDVTSVRMIQRFLNAFHSSSVGVDGDFGPVTEFILRDWQAINGLLVDGVWNVADAVEAQIQIDATADEVNWTSIGASDGPVRFTTPGGDDPSTTPGDVLAVCDDNSSLVHHRGSITVSSQSDGNRVVAELSAEAYLRGVVPKEISAGWADDGDGRGVHAVRAQAVAARSYGLQQNRYSYADTCDTQACQVYGGAATRAAPHGLVRSVEHSNTDRAIADTAGVIRRWSDGHPNAGGIVATEFSASNGPRTAGGAFPPVDDVLGDRTAGNPNHRWTRVLDADVLEARYGLGQLTAATTVEPAAERYQGFDGIWFNDVVFTGTTGTERIQAWDLRRSLDLPSPGFTVRVITEDSTPRSLGVIGDSVTVSVGGDGAAELDSVLDGTFDTAIIDAEVGRCTSNPSCRGLSGLEAIERLPMDLDVVVVELGYNDGVANFAEAIDQMMAAARAHGVGSVVWVNMADIVTTSAGASRYAAMNAALDAAADRSSDLTILDWNAATTGFEARSRWFADGVHLTATGRSKYSLWLRSQVVTSAPSHRLVPPRRIELPVGGALVDGPGGTSMRVPATATAAALNIATVDPADAGFVTVWPCEMRRPTTSNLNYAARQVVANNVLAPIDENGFVCLYSLASTDLIVDVAGWVDGDAIDAGFRAVTPVRLIDTRVPQGWTGIVEPNTPVSLDFRGRSVTLPDGTAATIPADVAAVNINLTATENGEPGYLTVWPCDDDRPVASSLNYQAGDTVANGVTASLDGSGRLCIYAKSRTHVVIDLLGWFDAGSLLTATAPSRVVDSRIGTGAPAALVVPATPLAVPVRGLDLATPGGRQTVPTSASAVILDVAAVDPTQDGFLTVWPCESQRPIASNINYRAGRTVANGVIAPISADGTICVYSKSPSDVIVDVRGWFDGGSTSGGFAATVPTRLVDTRIRVGPVPVS